MTRNYYGIFGTNDNGNAVWGLRTRKMDAVKDARRMQGYVLVLPVSALAGGSEYGIDAPTFKALATDVVADYRN